MATVADIASRLKARARTRRGRALSARAERRQKLRYLPALLLFSDALRLPDPIAALDRLPRGSGVVLRHYGAPGRAALARALAPRGRERAIKVLIGADARLAIRAGAAGLHLPEAQMCSILAFGSIRQRKRFIVTISAHSLGAVFRAATRGADAAILGPVFPTASHPGRPGLGPLRFARFCRQSPIPIYAIGGIGPGNAARLKDSGAVGIAGIGAIGLPEHRGTRGMARSRR